MVFIRLAGCNLRCSFCDTKYAWGKGRKIDIEGIMDKIKGYPCKRICITGGEPLLQDLKPLTDVLKQENYWIAVETNGTIWQDIKVNWITVSPKREGTRFFKYGYNRKFLKVANEFKYVITNRNDIELIDRRIKVPVVLQPVDNNPKIAKWIVKFLKKYPEKEWHLKFQIHKILGIR